MRRIDLPVVALFFEFIFAMGIEGGVKMETMEFKTAMILLVVTVAVMYLTVKWYEYEEQREIKAARARAKHAANSLIKSQQTSKQNQSKNPAKP